MADTPSYQVVARRYRPQRFADLVGQEHVARGLSGAIESGRIGHAYLFTGARGVGKTSAARIFAKALECAAGPAGEPCNACDACREISAGQDVDVVEIDAASNRGIDEIRQLRQNVAVRPARGRYKIYIIDEVHMLTREAFNALLKTLEEPPAHVKFVLCTTEPDKLPITILSRCQRFDFTTVDPPAIARRLAQIVEAEGAEVSAEALNLIARRAAGSMRDSQSLLEQLLGSATGAVGVDDVHAMIGTGREERVGEIVTALVDRDAARALAALDAAVHAGADPGGVLDQLVAALRDCLLASVGCGPELMTQQGGLGVDLAAVGGRLGTATLLAMLQILDQALSRMAVSGHAAVLAEMAVVRLARLEDLESLSDVLDGLAAGGGGSQPPASAAAAPREKKTTDVTLRADEPPVRVSAGVSETRSEPRPEPETEIELQIQVQTETGSPAVAAASLPDDPLAAWRAASEACGGLAVDFAATAASATWRDHQLEVSFPATAATAVAFLNRTEVMAAIVKSLAGMAGRPIVCRLVTSEPAAAEPKRPDARQESRREPARPAAASQVALLREAADHPLVAHARDLFDAAIRRVEPRQRRPSEEAARPAAPQAVATHAGGEAEGDDDAVAGQAVDAVGEGDA